MASRPLARPQRRAGQLIPMVGVILVIFGFLAFAYSYHSQTVTATTGLTIYGLQAHQLALAAADEAGLVVKERFDDLGGSPAWKMEVVNGLKEADDGTPFSIEKDLSGDLPEALAMIQGTGNAELLQARVRLHGFHRLHYASTDFYDSEDSFYHEDFAFKDREDAADPTKVKPAKDWVGYATTQVRVSVRGIERQVQITRDIKVVDVVPPAREFAMFNFMPLTAEQENAKLGFTSLNTGGKMAIWPNEAGRVAIRGPYRVITEGKPDGGGGKRRSGEMRQNLSYPVNDDKWRKWAAVPRLRALLYDQLSSAIVGGDNIRPKDEGIHFVTFLRLPFTVFATLVTSDPISECASGKYFCGATRVGNQKFSIWGRPGDPNVPPPPEGVEVGGAGNWSMFRGVKVKYPKSGKPTAAGLYDQGPNVPGGSNGDSIEPEGFGLWGLYKVASYKNVFGLKMCISWVPCCAVEVDGFTITCVPAPGCIGFQICTLDAPADLDANNVANISGNDYIAAPYGLHYMEKEHVPTWMSVLSAVIEFVASYAAGTTLAGAGGTPGVGTVFGTWGNVTLQGIGQAMVFAGRQVAVSMAMSSGLSAFGATSGGPSVAMPTAAQAAQAVPDGILPPKFRPVLRAATRIHPTLAEALEPDGARLNLDGVVAVESLPADGPAAFKYRGKGVLFSTTNGEDNNKTPYLGDIEPEDNAADWMTFQFWVQRAAKPDGGDCQVKLNSNKVEMSIYAQEGVTTEQESAIFGNLITQTINKHKIPDEATLQVFYNVKRLAPSASGGPQEAEWGDGTWTRVSVSPRISGYYDRYR